MLNHCPSALTNPKNSNKMLMQAGFTALETGMTRAKNSINVAMKNVTDFITSILIFFLVGYGLMFGASFSGWFGTTGFALDNLTTPLDYALFVFQATFAGTAATIVSGAVAERIRFSAYIIISAIVVAVIYPVSGHWIWGSGGWLSEKHMVDFAGSTVVHSVGGWVGLAGALVLGPRIGRFDAQGKPRKLHGHNLVIAVVGVLILWFGWFGFNGGSTLHGDLSIAKIVANTILAASGGGIACFITSLLVHSGEVQLDKLLNGIVGGLVAITAGCAVVEPSGAIWLGLIAGVLVFFAEEFVLHVCKIDDPVNVIAAHGVGGAWGTIGLAFFANESQLPLGDMWSQLWVQCEGVVAVFLWSFITGLLLFWLFNQFNMLRVTEEADHIGLNIHEHGASSGLFDTMTAMQNIIGAHKGLGEGDLTQRIEVEFGTESGDVAHLFNQLIETFHNTIVELKQGIVHIGNASKQMTLDAENMDQDAKRQQQTTDAIAEAIAQMSMTIHNIAHNAKHSVTYTQNAALEVSQIKESTDSAKSSIQSLSDGIKKGYQVITDLNQQTANITHILQTIRDISDQTNLLALNAAIEAARAGDAGRGFAVVADEVRNLSAKTNQATNDIQSLIKNFQSGTLSATSAMRQSQEQAEHSVKIVLETAESMHKVENLVQQIQGMTHEMATATEQQNQATHAIEQNITDIEKLANDSASRASHAHQSSSVLSTLAQKLNLLVNGLKVKSTETSVV